MAITPAVRASRQNAKAVKGLAARARESRARVARARADATTDYGTAMGGAIIQKFGPAMERGQAGVDTMRSLSTQARAQTAIAQTSDATNAAMTAQMPKAQEAAMARVTQNAQPGFISAKAAMKEADAYAARIGIDMKKMKWEAKAQIYESIINQNNQMAMMVFQNEIQLKNQQAMYDLQTKIAQDEAMKTAAPVVRSVNSAMPAMVELVKNMATKEKGEDFDPLAIAEEWASTQTADPAARAILVNTMTDLLNNAHSHVVDGSLDKSWVENSVANSILTQFPQYANAEAEVRAALGTGVDSWQLASAPIDAGFGSAQEEWMHYTTARAQQGFGFAAPLVGAVDALITND